MSNPLNSAYTKPSTSTSQPPLPSNVPQTNGIEEEDDASPLASLVTQVSSTSPPPPTSFFRKQPTSTKPPKKEKTSKPKPKPSPQPSEEPTVTVSPTDSDGRPQTATGTGTGTGEVSLEGTTVMGHDTTSDGGREASGGGGSGGGGKFEERTVVGKPEDSASLKSAKKLKRSRSGSGGKEKKVSIGREGDATKGDKKEVKKKEGKGFKRFLLLFIPCIPSNASAVSPPVEKFDESRDSVGVEKVKVNGKDVENEKQAMKDSQTQTSLRPPHSPRVVGSREEDTLTATHSIPTTSPPTGTTLVESTPPTPLPPPSSALLTSTSTSLQPVPVAVQEPYQEISEEDYSSEEEIEEDEELETTDQEDTGPMSLEELIQRGGLGVPIGDDGLPRPLLPPVGGVTGGERKCLVLDLDETLVHSNFKVIGHPDFIVPVEIDNKVHHVYVLKRPGVDRFLERMGQLYEIAIFTASVSNYADPLLDMLDVHRVIKHRLFREHCYSHNGAYIKDLSQLGRPLRDTIIIDNSPACYMFHPNHAVPVSSWFNDPHDTELTDLETFLEDLSNSDDVRIVLNSSR